jgi:hypothetical protein
MKTQRLGISRDLLYIGCVSAEEICRVAVLQFESIVVIEKIPRLLGERVGCECCVKQG